jgi:hypothetical protein
LLHNLQEQWVLKSAPDTMLMGFCGMDFVLLNTMAHREVSPLDEQHQHSPYALKHNSIRPFAQLFDQLHHHVISRLCLDTQQGALELLTGVKRRLLPTTLSVLFRVRLKRRLLLLALLHPA